MNTTVLRTLLAGVAFVGSGCGGGSPSTGSGQGGSGGPGAPSADASVIYCRGADSKKLDPHDIDDGESASVCNQIYENLVTYDLEDPRIVPGLAESWTVSADGLAWTFMLRAGVRFHDGTPCDGDAVKWSLDRMRDSKHPDLHGASQPYGGDYAVIERVEVVSPTEVRLVLKTPSAVLLRNLAMFPASVVSPSAVRKHGAEIARNPVGTGPFRFVEWIPNEKIVLERWDGYCGEKAKVRRAIFIPVPEQSARVERLKRGEAHLMDNVDFSMVETIRAVPGLVVEMRPGMNFSYLAMNNDRKPFDDARVRRAVAHAVDKQKLLKLAYFGYGKTGPNPMPPTIPGYHDGLADRPHDPAKARALLAEAGFPGGLDTDLWAMPNPRPYCPKPRECAQVLKEDLAAVGIRVTIKSPPWSEYLDRTKVGEHPMCILGWTTDNGDPDNFLYALLSKDRAQPPAQNVSFYRSDVVTALLVRAQGETDEARRWNLYRQAQEAIHADCPMVPLAYMPLTVARRAEVRGYPLNPIGIVRLHTVMVGER
ncbi:MAG: ABC transporter substrate-binding protein [Planctomycetales bacterium]|nr:ABC transporter substrate-binding protein [Planctomycetales bacterium]